MSYMAVMPRVRLPREVTVIIPSAPYEPEFCMECDFEEHNCQCCSICCEAGHDEDECLLGASA